METTWQSRWQSRVAHEDDLLRFVQDVGFCSINQLERYPDFPNAAVAMGKRDALWDAWFWKDDLHIQRRCYYTRLFGGRPGLIAMEWLPCFIATNGAVVDELALTGGLPAQTLDIYRELAVRIPVSTRVLKKALTPEARKATAAALTELERRFIITKADIAGRERATYCYIWELAERWMPEAFAAADRLGRKAARAQILARLEELGVEATPALCKSVFHWVETPAAAGSPADRTK